MTNLTPEQRATKRIFMTGLNNTIRQCNQSMFILENTGKAFGAEWQTLKAQKDAAIAECQRLADEAR